MLSIRRVLALIALATVCAFGQDVSPEKQEKINRLIEITRAQELVVLTRQTVRDQMKTAFAQQIQATGVQMTPAQQKVMDEYFSKLQDLMTQMLSWDRLRALYVKLYSENFSDQELEGILAFYKTPAGQALLDRMPSFMKEVMSETQQMVQGMAPQMQQLNAEMMRKLKEATPSGQNGHAQSLN